MSLSELLEDWLAAIERRKWSTFKDVPGIRDYYDAKVAQAEYAFWEAMRNNQPRPPIVDDEWGPKS